VRYDAVNATLLNEFLKSHRKMEPRQKQIDAAGGATQTTDSDSTVRMQIRRNDAIPRTIANHRSARPISSR